MLVNRSSVWREKPWAPPSLARLRLQVPLGILLVAVLPALILDEPNFYAIAEMRSSSNTFVGVVVATFISLLIFRRLAASPGLAPFGYVFPSVGAAFVIPLLTFFIFRIDYSRSYFILGALICSVSLVGLWVFYRRKCAPMIHIIPGGEVDPKLFRPFHITKTLFEPRLPDGRNSILVADLRADLDPQWERLISDAALRGIPVYHVKQLAESVTGKVQIEHLSENSLGSIIPNLIYIKLKRVADVLVALYVLPLFLTILPIVAAAIKLDSRGSVFFRQERMGFRGQPFKVFKFRTMSSSHKRSADHRHEAITRHDDIRVTRLGRILRRYRIDELPQIINVLLGQMSWIGPRPEALPLSEWYSAELPFYAYRHIVRPGITGWAQVNQGHVAELDEVHTKLHYDFYYIKHFSAWLDAMIVLRSIKIIIFGNGAK